MPDSFQKTPGESCYFFTVKLRNRHSKILTDHTERLLAAVRVARAKHPFTINAWVVLPNHLHCIWTLPAGDRDYRSRWRVIRTTFAATVGGTMDIWQSRYRERVIHSEDAYRKHIDYVHANPVKHGLVHYALDWPFSSFHEYVAEGAYPEDWNGTRESGLEGIGNAGVDSIPDPI